MTPVKDYGHSQTVGRVRELIENKPSSAKSTIGATVTQGNLNLIKQPSCKKSVRSQKGHCEIRCEIKVAEKKCL